MRRLGIAVLVAAAVVHVGGAAPARAQVHDGRPAGTKNADEPGLGASFLPEEPLEALTPKQPLTAEQADRLEARKLFVVAYGLLLRNEKQSALETLKAAHEKDPGSLPILEELVQLTADLKRPEEAINYCQQALKLDPKNYKLLKLYGDQLRAQGNVDAAVNALELASQTPNLRREDVHVFYEIRESLKNLYGQTGDAAGRAAALRDLIDVMENGRDYGLDRFTHNGLQRNLPFAYQQLAQSLLAARQYEEAEAVVREATNKVPNGDHRFARTLAQVYVAMGRDEDALAQIEQYMQETMDKQVFVLFGQILGRLGRTDELLPTLEGLYKRNKHNPVLALYYAETLLDAGKLDEAQKLLLEHKNRPEAIDLLATVYQRQNDPARLLETLVNLSRVNQRLNPNSNTFRARLAAVSKEKDLVEGLAKEVRSKATASFEENLLITTIAELSKSPEIGEEFFQRCVEQRPTDFRLLYQFWQFLVQNDRAEPALGVCDRALQRGLNVKLFRELKAITLSELERYDEAVEVLKKAIEESTTGEELFELNRRLGLIYQAAGDYEKSIDVYKRMIADNPNNPDAPRVHYQLSNVYMLQGRMDQSEEVLLKLVDPKADIDDRIKAAANNDLGYIWADAGKNLQQAYEMIRKALDLSQEPKAAYLDSMGWVLFKLHRFQEAVDYLKQASELEEGQDAVIFDHLGDAYLQLDKYDLARKAWEKAVEFYKKHPQEQERAKASMVQEKITQLDAQRAKSATETSQ